MYFWKLMTKDAVLSFFYSHMLAELLWKLVYILITHVTAVNYEPCWHNFAATNPVTSCSMLAQDGAKHALKSLNTYLLNPDL